jgi:hypothetical protein
MKFAAYNAQGNIAAFYDDVASPVPDGIANVIEITDAQWQACLTTTGYTVQNGTLVVPTPLTAAQIAAQQTAAAWAAYQTTARVALAFNDAVYTRCGKAGVAYPAAWLARDVALRAIAAAPSGDPTQPLPAAPAFPPGT